MKRHVVKALVTCVVVGGLTAPAAWAECVAIKSPERALGQAIGVRHDGGVPAQIVDRAIALWRRCENYGSDFPAFLNGEDGTQTVWVRYHDGSSGSEGCGWFQGRTIHLYGSAVSPEGRSVSCGSIEQNLAHELGHVLGLRGLSNLESCTTHIMAPIRPSTAHSRSVSAEECGAVGRKWTTFDEAGVDRRAGTLPVLRTPAGGRD